MRDMRLPSKREARPHAQPGHSPPICQRLGDKVANAKRDLPLRQMDFDSHPNDRIQ
jgi:hypothetical protein